MNASPIGRQDRALSDTLLGKFYTVKMHNVENSIDFAGRKNEFARIMGQPKKKTPGDISKTAKRFTVTVEKWCKARGISAKTLCQRATRDTYALENLTAGALRLDTRMKLISDEMERIDLSKPNTNAGAVQNAGCDTKADI